MTLSKSLLLLPVASLLIAGAIGAGACSSSVSISTSTPPGTIQLPTNVTLDGPCSGDVYFADDSGYVFCNGDTWAYTVDEPGGDYSEDTQYASYASDTYDSDTSDTDTSNTDTSDTDTSNTDTSDTDTGTDTDQSGSDTTDTDSSSSGIQQG